jgi:hypothetical protein
VASDGVSGDLPVKLTDTANRFDTSNAAGVLNQSTSVVAATGDWLGDGTGPSDRSLGSGSSVSADVNGTGSIQERGNASDSVINASGYTIAAS